MTEMITIPREDYDRMRERIEDLEDILAAQSAATDAPLPSEWAMRILEGEHPITVWREYRGKSLADVARAAKVSPNELDDMEQGRTAGFIEIYRAVADALGLPLDAVVP